MEELSHSGLIGVPKMMQQYIRSFPSGKWMHQSRLIVNLTTILTYINI